MPRTQGKFVVKQLPFRIRSTSDGRSYVIPYVGPYKQLLSMEPAIGATMPGFGNLYTVSEVNIEKGKSLEGTMEITVSLPRPDTPNNGQDNQIGDPIYELDWREARRPIEEHPECGYLNPDRPYYRYPARATHETENIPYPRQENSTSANGPVLQRTWDDWMSLDEEDYVRGGRWSLQDYRELKEKGANDYPTYTPIARSTIYSRFRKAPTGGVGALGNPPSDCGAPSGWVYLKTCSRTTKVARLYTLVQEWEGGTELFRKFFA